MALRGRRGPWALGEGKLRGQGGKGVGKIWNQEKKADKETFNQTQNPHWPPNGAFVQGHERVWGLGEGPVGKGVTGLE